MNEEKEKEKGCEDHAKEDLPSTTVQRNKFLPFHQISRHCPIVFHAYFMRPIQDESWSCNSRNTSWFARKGLKMHCVLDPSKWDLWWSERP